MNNQSKRHHFNGVKPLAAAVSAALIAGTALPAMSQDTPDRSRSLMLEEVVVTAQKREQSVNDIPMSITAFSGNALTEMGIQDTADLASIVPGFAYSDSVLGAPVYTMRGVGFNEASAQAASTVGVYIDEIGIALPIMTRGAMLDVERVEVLKGPQGTLYGRNSTGGAVNYIANKPSEEFEGAVSASYGRYETLLVDGFVTGALTDNLQARLAAKVIDSGEGWQESVTRNDKLGEQDKLSLRLSLAAQLGENTDALFSLGYWEDNSDSIAPQFQQVVSDPDRGPTGLLQEYAPSRPVNGDAKDADWTQGKHPKIDMDNTSVSLQLTHDINNDLAFKSLTGYSEFNENDSFYERSGHPGVPASAVPDGWKQGDIAGVNTGNLVADGYQQNSDIKSFSQELRLSGELDRVSWIAGAYYGETKVDNVATQILEIDAATWQAPVPYAGFDRVANKTDQETTTWALFASADWNIGEKLVLTTGLRYTDDKADYKGCSADSGNGALADFFNIALGGAFPDAGTEVGGCATINETGNSALVKDDLQEDSWSWRLAADYSITDDFSTYASYSRGFKAGSYPTLGALNVDQLEPVVQERLDAYEIGFKATLADGAAQLNGAVFYYDYKDKQLLTKIYDSIFQTLWTLDNAPESDVTGAELDLQWVPVEGLTLGGGVSYIDTEISDFAGSNQLGQFVNFDGSDFPFSAQVQATVTAKYEWNITNALVASIAVDASYTDDSLTDYTSNDKVAYDLPEGNPDRVGSPYKFDDRFEIDSYTLVNARVGIETADGQWAASLWGRNLTDEFYTTNTIKQSDIISNYAGMPRTYGVRVDYSF